MIIEKRVTIPIEKIEMETKQVRSFCFNIDLKAEPGQFIMLTDFKGGEKPFSISDSYADKGKSYLTITIKKIGALTERLFSLKEGDLLSFRGAYGNPFYIPGNDKDKHFINPINFKPILCGGGFGLPPVYFLAKRLLQAGVLKENIRVIAAARTEQDLLFEKNFLSLGIKYIGAVETPGSNPKKDICRFTGIATDVLAKITDYNFLYASGPDLMMKSLMSHIPKNIEYQFLFERYMKCAIGICGSCSTDPDGLRICKEGPALWKKQIEKLEDFGVYKRTASGQIERFKNRFSNIENKNE